MRLTLIRNPLKTDILIMILVKQLRIPLLYFPWGSNTTRRMPIFTNTFDMLSMCDACMIINHNICLIDTVFSLLKINSSLSLFILCIKTPSILDNKLYLNDDKTRWKLSFRWYLNLAKRGVVFLNLLIFILNTNSLIYTKSFVKH